MPTRSSKQKCRWSITSAILSLCVVLSVAAAAQSQLYVYPLKQQSSEQQDRDRYECHRWAVQQTGFDPSKAYPTNPNSLDPQPYRPSQPHVVKGAARGAALGAVGGAITGNAGKGAAAGAAMGGLAGGFRRRDERRQQAAQQQANASSAAASQHTNYTRAMAACLEGRGYSVK
jgi:YMGG-like Gly-zipper